MNELSLEDLTAQLQAVQDKKSTVRLSERNVVELVNKLKELELLDRSLLHTTNGKEYITRSQLQKEIEETVQSNGGRISLAELSDALNVDLSHCEVESAVVIDRSHGRIRCVQEELMTEDYFDGIALEIDERLSAVGMLRIGELAVQYGLSQELLLSVTSTRLGGILKGEMLNSMLYTQAYMERLEAQLRGALIGTTAPIQFSALLKGLRLEEAGVMHLVQNLVGKLIDRSLIKGELKATGQWVPDIHSKAQSASIVSVFRHDGWISLSAVRRATSSETSFIERNFPNAVRLETVIVSHEFIEGIDAEIEDAFENCRWCDVTSVVPTDWSESDAMEIVRRCGCLERNRSLRLMTDTCIVTEACIEELKQKVQDFARELAKESFSRSKQKTQKQESVTDASTSKTEEEDIDADKGKGKKKGKSKQRSKSKQSGTGKQGKESDLMSLCPTGSSLASQLVTWHPDMEDVDQLAEALAEELLSDAVSSYQSTIEEAKRSTDKRRQEMKEAAGKGLESTVIQFWLFSKGIEALISELDAATVDLLRKHLIKTTGYDALDWMLRFIQLQEPGADEEVPHPMIPIAQGERSKVMGQLPVDVRETVEAVMQSLKQDDLTTVSTALDDGMQSCGIRIQKRDKKTEKQQLNDLQASWISNLELEETPSTALTILLPLLVLQEKGLAVSLPGRAMPSFVEFLKPSMQQDHHSMLLSFHGAVVEDLKNRSQSDNDVDTSNEAALKLLPDIKRLVRNV